VLSISLRVLLFLNFPRFRFFAVLLMEVLKIKIRLEQLWNNTDMGKPKYSEKNHPSATPYNTKPTLTDQGS